MLWHLLCGYVIIYADGLGQERFLSLLLERGIKIKEVKRNSYTSSVLQVSLHQLKKLRRTASECRMHLRLGKATGIAGFVPFLRTHPAVFAGIFAAIICIFILSSFCLSVDIRGNEQLSEFALAEALQDLGAKPFALKSSLDTALIEREIKSLFPDILYAKAHFNGTNLILQIIENIPAPVLPMESYLPITAKKEGIVCDVTVFRGKALVSPGQKVSAGEILIASEYTMEDGTEMHVTASGSIMAQVQYIAEIPVAADNCEYLRTGNKETSLELRIGKKRFRLSGKNPYETFETEETVLAKLGENSYLPFSLAEISFFETKPFYTQKSAAISVLSAKEAAFYRALGEIPEGAELLSAKLYLTKTNGSPVARAILITKEEIGIITGGNFGNTAEDPH